MTQKKSCSNHCRKLRFGLQTNTKKNFKTSLTAKFQNLLMVTIPWLEYFIKYLQCIGCQVVYVLLKIVVAKNKYFNLLNFELHGKWSWMKQMKNFWMIWRIGPKELRLWRSSLVSSIFVIFTTPLIFWWRLKPAYSSCNKLVCVRNK